jgi:ethanolamine utilization protein EutA
MDAKALGAIIDRAYQAAGLHPDDVDAGAVILTGEALRRENSESIAEILAEQGGEFGVRLQDITWSPCWPSTAQAQPSVLYDLKHRISNVDIGGGTTKLGLVQNGELVRKLPQFIWEGACSSSMRPT